MKQIKTHIAVSLDGFIATLDHELDWMPQFVKSLIGKEYDAADTLLMGVIPIPTFLNIGAAGRIKASL